MDTPKVIIKFVKSQKDKCFFSKHAIQKDKRYVSKDVKNKSEILRTGLMKIISIITDSLITLICHDKENVRIVFFLFQTVDYVNKKGEKIIVKQM